ncbi:Na+/H+ antiporter NhaC family protein [Mucilaginibacter celer]|uniref:Sodium:proton antiporter n=1 Tax=Mucilaginibacter celer TaxID=2305508 RepID=A0A494VI28_9SPHI|nr:Na+/H+ antiporter NhaC family protein [Mucilaginibacter celer]AYL94487.1 sodium:proton antiporter [Mucilaginibacter celer]
MTYGALALIPPLVVIVLAIALRASFEALLLGCIVGFIIIGYHDHTNFFSDFIATFYKVMKDDSTVWVILVCGLYGSLIGLMVKSGGAMKFGEDALKYIKTKRAALFGTWFLGLFIFLDDYLSALTVGITMKKITDHFKVSREYLAYIVNTTAAPWCVIVPLSTWTVFIGSILEKCNFAALGQGNHVYLSVIPYVTYGWVSVFMIPLVIMGLVPMIGRMQKAEALSLNNVVALPTDTEEINIQASGFGNGKKASSMYFIIPIAITLICTFLMNYDALKGIMIGVAFTFVYYLIIKLGTFQQLSETIFSGFNSMVYALALVVMSYILKDVGDKMGLTSYVINGVKPYISKELLPAIIFLSITLITYTTGSSWGVYAVVIPIVIPLAHTLGANVLISVGAVVSTGVVGSNACLYSDTTILTSQSTDISNLKHSFSQLPYALIAFAISTIIYIVMGYTIA